MGRGLLGMTGLGLSDFELAADVTLVVLDELTAVSLCLLTGEE